MPLRPFSLSPFPSFLLSALALCALTACGQDTPLTPDRPAGSAGQNWPDTIAGLALAAPTLGPGEAAVSFAEPGDLPWPACAPDVEHPVAVTAGFPPGFPLPPGLRLFKALTLYGDANNIELVGYTPLTFGNAVRFVVEALPAAGYMLGRGDSEGAGEAETTFAGPDWTGGVMVASLMDCEGVTEWVIIVTKR